jgi:endoribonuclease Dicer
LSNAKDAFSLESFEVIGDSVLKFVVTAHIMSHFPVWNEGQMTALRTRLVSNKHLFVVGSEKNLGSILAGGFFEPESAWIPSGLAIPSRFGEICVKNDVTYSVYQPMEGASGKMERLDWIIMNDEVVNEVVESRKTENPAAIKSVGSSINTYTHAKIGEKSVADCVEALIGAYYLHGGMDSALHLMNWVGLRGPTSDPKVAHPYTHFKELQLEVPDYPADIEPTFIIPFLHQVEETLSYP